jgi:hypothetical protein
MCMWPGGSIWPRTATTQMTRSPSRSSAATDHQSGWEVPVCAAARLRGQPESVQGGKPKHDDKQGDLNQEEVAVVGCDQVAKAVGHEPGVDETAQDQKRDAPRRQRGEAPDHAVTLERRELQTWPEEQEQGDKLATPFDRGQRVPWSQTKTAHFTGWPR